MNTGELLVSLSGLPSGSALAHLTAVTTGTGTGETIYAQRMGVLVQQPKHTVTSRTKRSAQAQPAEVRTSSSSQKQTGKYAYVCLRTNTAAVVTTDDEAYISTNFEYVL